MATGLKGLMFFQRQENELLTLAFFLPELVTTPIPTKKIEMVNAELALELKQFTGLNQGKFFLLPFHPLRGFTTESKIIHH